MLTGGALHLFAPEAFFRIVPDGLPKRVIVYGSGLVELAIGAGVVIARTRRSAGLGFALLCVAFLPLHLWDFFRPDPIFPPPYWLAVRILVQLGLIWLGLLLWRGAAIIPPRPGAGHRG